LLIFILNCFEENVGKLLISKRPMIKIYILKNISFSFAHSKPKNFEQEVKSKDPIPLALGHH
jgi:hypothetical protein